MGRLHEHLILFKNYYSNHFFSFVVACKFLWGGGKIQLSCLTLPFFSVLNDCRIGIIQLCSEYALLITLVSVDLQIRYY